MTTQELIVNPADILPKVSAEMAASFREFSDIFEDKSIEHFKNKEIANQLRQKRLESQSGKNVEFSQEDASKLSDICTLLHINNCYLGFVNLRLQKLTNDYVSANSDFKLLEE